MDIHLDLDALHQLTTSLGLLVASDTRTLENDHAIGSYIYSASRALADAAGFLFEAIQLEQDAIETMGGTDTHEDEEFLFGEIETTA
jgi:hypothetical protein